MAVPYILAASELARVVFEAERASSEEEFGPAFERIFGSSVACAIMATAALEAYANELFADRHLNFPNVSQDLVELLWTEFEAKTLLDKFDLALQLRQRPRLKRGSQVVQSFDRLVRLRNSLVHFKPEWFDDPSTHEQLSKRLNGYLCRSRWLQSEQLFPRAWACSDSTSWLMRTAVAFISHFSNASGLPDKFGSLPALKLVDGWSRH